MSTGKTQPHAKVALITALCTFTAFGVPAAAHAEPVTVPNGTQFTDASGAPVHAHGGGIIEVGDHYYWFGENRHESHNGFRYLSVYRSTDLKNWEWRNDVLSEESDPELQDANLERPKVIHNEETGQFVMWLHKENSENYAEARAAVAVSDTVDGDYEWQGSFRPLDHMSRDITLFVDQDGTGYMVSAARENYDLHIYRLTDDYTGIDELVANPWPGDHREAPALFERDGVYYMLTSGSTGWDPNQQMYATATDIEGDWSEMTEVGDETGFDSQTAFVLPVQGTEETSYLYMGDRWGNATGGVVNDSEYVWLPIEFPTDESMELEWAPELDIDTGAGTVDPHDG